MNAAININASPSPNLFVSQQNLLQGLAAWFGFEETDYDRIDYTANLKLACVGTDVLSTPGIVGNAATFDGTAQNVLQGGGFLDFSKPFTISGWFNFPDQNGNFLEIYDAASATTVFSISYGTSDEAPVFFIFGNEIDVDYPSAGDWNHYVLTWDGSVFSYYTDGALDWTTPITNSNAFLSAATTFGGAEFSVDEFALWQRVLNPSEIIQLYNNGNGFGYPVNQLTISRLPNIGDEIGGWQFVFSICTTGVSGFIVQQSADGKSNWSDVLDNDTLASIELPYNFLQSGFYYRIVGKNPDGDIVTAPTNSVLI